MIRVDDSIMLDWNSSCYLERFINISLDGDYPDPKYSSIPKVTGLYHQPPQR